MNNRIYSVIISILAILFLGLAGCFQITVQPPSTSTPATAPSATTPSTTTPSTPTTPAPASNPPDTSPALPAVVLFTAAPGTITTGGATILSWDVTDASSISITPGIGPVGYLNGSVSVTPTATTDYVLTAANGEGVVTATAEVGVFQTAGLPVINHFTATPPTILVGSSTLSWDVSNVTAISITPGVGNVGSTGSSPVTPASTTIYTMTASNPAGAVYHAVQVTKIVIGIRKPITTINPNVITPILPVDPNFKFPINPAIINQPIVPIDPGLKIPVNPNLIKP